MIFFDSKANQIKAHMHVIEDRSCALSLEKIKISSSPFSWCDGYGERKWYIVGYGAKISLISRNHSNTKKELWTQLLRNAFYRKYILDAMLLCEASWIIVAHECCTPVLPLKWNYACW